MYNRKLNLSQREIAMSEQMGEAGAVNTISVQLHLPEHTAQEVCQAAELVLDSADIFTAKLNRREREWELSYGEEKCSGCQTAAEQSGEAAKLYMEQMDQTPMDPDRELYRAEVIPLTEGGSILYVRFHHVIIDGYGMSLFAQRVLDVLAGKEIPKSCFFTCSEEEKTAKNESEADSSSGKEFWRTYFEEADFEPAIFPEKARGTKYHSFHAEVQENLAGEMTAFAKKEALTEAYLFAGAYAFYLAEATGKKDAVFLMPRLNRRPEQMNTLGCYTLLVPVRVQIDPEDTFVDLCAKTAEASRKASVQKDFGYDRILSVLRENDVISEALSEYVFNFYRFRFETDLQYHISYSVAGAMRNHITCSIFHKENGSYDIRLDHHDSIYDKERAAYLGEALLSILTQGLSNPKLSDMRAIGQTEWDRILSVRGKEFAVDTELTIPSLFRRAVSENAEKPALYAGDCAMTFAELDRISDRIAVNLVQRGVQSGDCVAFMLNRDYRLIPTILGISKAGAAFIPVDPAYPKDRVTYIIENSRAAYLISSENVNGSGKYDYLEINELIENNVDEAALNSILPEVKQDQLAYIIYTSGTTGRPKGVMLSHKGIANIVHPDNNPFNRDVTKGCHGIVAIGSICFDISLFEIFVPLMNGLFVELGSEKAMVDAVELSSCMTRHSADILHCTPSRIAAYLGQKEFVDALGGVQAILAAGEVLPGSLVEELRDKYGIRIYNGYGPTETTIGATITESGDTETIGLPIANMGIVLLNQNRKPVPYGAVGEICVWGNGVGIGYKDRPEETESKYIQWNGKRIYRTGDLGHLLEDGRLVYHGRNDRQIKLRGLRIELAEIEKVLGDYPGIAACSCLVRKIDRMEHLAAFYTAASDAVIDQEELRAHMKSRLTSYMVPDILKELETMPQTPNGKIDTKALAVEPITYIRTYREPVSAREKIVCGVFEQVLEIEKVGMDDNFFELGGNSLAAASAMLQIEDELGLSEGQADFGDLYKYPTPALLLEKLLGEIEENAGYDLAALDYHGIDEYLLAHTAETAEKRHLGNVLLTGVTGYLGIHMLIDLLKRPEICGRIVCLARPRKKLTAERRVRANLFYFAEEDFSDSYGDKWIVAEGDITNPDIFAEKCPVDRIDTVINCAANVAHFAYGDKLEKINTEGVKNLIRFALEQKAVLCQISTISVAGSTMDRNDPNVFTERTFHIGQKIFNQYIYSKYMAEYECLRAAVDEGLRIKFMRVGNLQGRIQDGEFQMNVQSNGFTRQLSSYIKIGAVPQSVYEGSVNFSPVDETAHNIVSLAATTDDTIAFNVFPPKEVAFADLFAGLEKLGHEIRVLPDAEFAEFLQQLKRTEEGKEQAEGLFTRGLERDCYDIFVDQTLTGQYIEQLSEGWSPVTEAYLDRYLSALDDIVLF